MNKNLLKYSIVIITSVIIVILIVYLLIPLKITQISPQDGEKNVDINQSVTITFNKLVNAKRFTLDIDPNTPTIIKSSKKNLNINFSEILKPNQTYALTLKSTTQFTDLNNQKTNQITWKFNVRPKTSEETYDTNFDEFYSKYPLARYLPYETDHFIVEGPNTESGFDITLKTIFNAGVNGPPIEEQEKAYKETIKSYKQEALDWIKTNNIDPNTLKINWFPTIANQY